MYTIDISQLSDESSILLLYQELESDKCCLLSHNGLLIAKIVPYAASAFTVSVRKLLGPE